MTAAGLFAPFPAACGALRGGSPWMGPPPAAPIPPSAVPKSCPVWMGAVRITPRRTDSPSGAAKEGNPHPMRTAAPAAGAGRGTEPSQGCTQSTQSRWDTPRSARRKCPKHGQCWEGHLGAILGEILKGGLPPCHPGGNPKVIQGGNPKALEGGRPEAIPKSREGSPQTHPIGSPKALGGCHRRALGRDTPKLSWGPEAKQHAEPRCQPPAPAQHSHVLGGQVPALHDADGQHAAPGHGEGGRDGAGSGARPRTRGPGAPSPCAGRHGGRPISERVWAGGRGLREWAWSCGVWAELKVWAGRIGAQRGYGAPWGLQGPPHFSALPYGAAGRAAAHSSAPCLRQCLLTKKAL